MIGVQIRSAHSDDGSFLKSVEENYRGAADLSEFYRVLARGAEAVGQGVQPSL